MMRSVFGKPISFCPSYYVYVSENQVFAVTNNDVMPLPAWNIKNGSFYVRRVRCGASVSEIEAVLTNRDMDLFTHITRNESIRLTRLGCYHLAFVLGLEGEAVGHSLYKFYEKTRCDDRVVPANSPDLEVDHEKWKNLPVQYYMASSEMYAPLFPVRGSLRNVTFHNIDVTENGEERTVRYCEHACMGNSVIRRNTGEILARYVVAYEPLTCESMSFSDGQVKVGSSTSQRIGCERREKSVTMRVLGSLCTIGTKLNRFSNGWPLDNNGDFRIVGFIVADDGSLNFLTCEGRFRRVRRSAYYTHRDIPAIVAAINRLPRFI